MSDQPSSAAQSPATVPPPARPTGDLPSGGEPAASVVRGAGPARLAASAGVIVARVLVPAYVAAGALLKLFTGAPEQLPEPVQRAGGALGMLPLRVLLLVVGVELVAAALMALHRGLGRWLGVVVLAAFAAVLGWQRAQGQATCGCFGAVSAPTGVMLAVDLALLAALLLLPGARGPGRPSATVATAAGGGARTGMSPGRWAALFAACAAAATTPVAVFHAGLMRWVDLALPAALGRPWSETVLFRHLPITPADFPEAEQTWVLYRRQCASCHEHFQRFFSPEALAQRPQRVIAVQVPGAGEAAGDGPDLGEVPCGACVFASLPATRHWGIPRLPGRGVLPITLRVRDGVVRAVEWAPGAM